MAYTTLTMTNGIEIKQVPLGYSWTTTFFGFFPAMLRGDWQMAILMFFVSLFLWAFSWILFGFCYNKIYFNSLVKKGYLITEIPLGIPESLLRSNLGLVKLPMVAE